MKLIHSVKEKCIQQNDDWGAMVQLRIENCGDLVAAEANYHHDCQVQFHTKKTLDGGAKGRPSGSYDDKK